MRSLDTPVGDIMVRRYVSVDMDDDLKTMREMLERLHIHHVLVIDDGALVGVVSDRDVLRALSPYAGTPSERDRDVATLAKRAHHLMSRHPLTVAPDCTIRDATRMMLDRNVSCLPVVSAAGIEGIITRTDVLRWLVASPD